MSLLQDQDYVISHLRAVYLDTCRDGIGEKVIKPSHLYITKGGPTKLNWAASTLISNTRAGSPPIPTDTLTDSVPSIRRNDKLRDDDDNRLVAGQQSLNYTRTIKRPRASTLPSFRPVPNSILLNDDAVPPSKSRSALMKGLSSEDLRAKVKKDIFGGDESPEDHDTLTTVYENDNSFEQPILRSGQPYDKESDDSDVDDEEELDDFDEVSVMDDDDDDDDDYDGGIEDALSGLSEEEDDSDIEDELELATQQIKMNSANPDDEDSVKSNSRPPSITTSPKVRRTNRKDPKRQRSLDVGASPVKVESTDTLVSSSTKLFSRPRTLSAKSGGSDYSPHLSAHRNSSDTVAGASVRSDILLEHFPNNLAGVKEHYKQLEIGLGLRDIGAQGAITTTTLQLPPPRPRSNSIVLKSPIRDGSMLAPISKVSNLSQAIKAKQASFDNPLEQYISASGRSDRKPVKLKIYMPSCNAPKTPWEVLVRTEVNVYNAIGFALYMYSEKTREPELPREMCDANRWTLRIVEDDGEPDEDFPALDRTRLISAYSFDEFALVEATADQVRDNEKKTPNVKKVNVAIAKEKNEMGEKDEEKQVEVKVYQYPFDDIVSKVFWSTTVSTKTYIGEILERVCQEKILDESMYTFKVAGTKILCAEDLTVRQLQGGYNLELTPQRVITAVNGYVEPSRDLNLYSNSGPGHWHGSSSGKQNVYTALAIRGAEDAKRGRNSMLVAEDLLPERLGGGYQKYSIWRRQPMSFISRHERVLAIDGEYVHILPAEDRMFLDSPKTSSFHIGQILKCKQSRKVLANFKIVVKKTTGPKRYDLEAQSAAESAEIVLRLRTLASNYQKQSNSIR